MLKYPLYSKTHLYLKGCIIDQLIRREFIFDWLYVLIVTAQIILFAHGARYIFHRIFPAMARSLITSFVVGACGLLSLFAVVNGFGLPMIWPGVLVFSAIQVLGLYEIWQNRRTIWRCLREHCADASIVTLIFFLSAYFWLNVYRNVPGLASFHDGMSHMGFWMHLFDYGHVFINMAPMHFVDAFGMDHPHFYPTGVHFFSIMFTGGWAELGLLSGAKAIKITLIVLMISVNLASYQLATIMFNGQKYRPYYALLFTLMISISQAYPYWGIGSGGVSRVGAQAFLLPLWIALIFDRSFTFRDLAGIFLLCFPATFFLHTQAMMTFCMLWGSVALMHIIFQRKQVFSSLKELSIPSGLLFCSVLIFVWIIKSSGAVDQIDGETKTWNPEELTWAAIEYKVLNFWGAYKYYITGFQAVLPDNVFLKKIFTIIGLWTLWLPLKNLLSHQTRSIMVFFFITFFGLMMTSFSDDRFIYRIGLTFFHQKARLYEMYYLAYMFIVCYGLLITVTFIKWFERTRKEPKHLHVAQMLATATLLVACLEAKDNARATKVQVVAAAERYRTNMRDDYIDSVYFLRETMEEDAIIAVGSMYHYIFYPETMRKSLFVYNECPMFKSDNCDKRHDYFHKINHQVDVLVKNLSDEERINGRDSDETCFQGLIKIDQPHYFIIENHHKKYKGLKPPIRICKDFEILTTTKLFYIAKIQP